MPPKAKITKQDIINTALDIVRREGVEAINARAIAGVLGCSTQPVFSNFASMDEVLDAVIAASYDLYMEYTKRETESGEYPHYKATGMAYIRFAKEEKELFKLLYMRDRSKDKEHSRESELYEQMKMLVHDTVGVDSSRAGLFHLEMWAFVHGIAVMLATEYCDLDWTLVSNLLSDTYQGLRKQYGME